jgi:hypothetical protein
MAAQEKTALLADGPLKVRRATRGRGRNKPDPYFPRTASAHQGRFDVEDGELIADAGRSGDLRQGQGVDGVRHHLGHFADDHAIGKDDALR